jgi:hypothetical protein
MQWQKKLERRIHSSRSDFFMNGQDERNELYRTKLQLPAMTAGHRHAHAVHGRVN